ncbi:NAD(P)/FAD-dependent oxidoreductase [Candidatus Phycosocius spiralis]|uniref:Dehydrogenase n=1 Tax=Candidatus Phycosocius spiralis TaxID=2815099 RepID=A0ABQ4PW53_9PROT|nr:NAD(P)/FAD-dependent oxidoreductase [Candidatus Phycosocius spiralis]GIU67227.1 dehydrogenase [Candidatus Phycosocius spiralis]
MNDVDAIIVGAGAVGLAVGRSLAVRGCQVIVLEKNGRFGEETSSRNSEVIHAGLYYPTGSLKARLCVAGKHAMYAFCAKRGIEARALGKLILAPSSSDLAALEQLCARGHANDIPDLELIGPDRIKGMEPEIVAQAAIWSPSTGIVDSHSYMLALLGQIEDHGGSLAPFAPFLGATPIPNGFEVRVGGQEPIVLTTSKLILSAGLWSTHAGLAVDGLDPIHVPVTQFAKGNYFTYGAKTPFTHLIYPMPSAGGLGIHVTPDMNGHARFGPDVQHVETLDYRVDESRKSVFAASIKAYWPKIDERLMQADYSGIRPKIGKALTQFEDFQILDHTTHGLNGLMCLFGIDSPGLTSSFAIGEEVASRFGLP